jgi:hypothetical protein
LLDLNQLLKKEEESDRPLATLKPDDTVVLQNLCLLAGQGGRSTTACWSR